MAYDVFFWTAMFGLVLLAAIRLVLRLAGPARGPNPGVLGVALALFVVAVATGFLQMLFAPTRQVALVDAGRAFPYLRQAAVIAGYVLLPFLFPGRPPE